VQSTHENTAHANPRFRVDVQLHDLLVKTQPKSLVPKPDQPLTLPEPVYPEHPELLAFNLSTAFVSSPYRSRGLNHQDMHRANCLLAPLLGNGSTYGAANRF